MKVTPYIHVEDGDRFRCERRFHKDGSAYYAVDIGEATLFLAPHRISDLIAILQPHAAQVEREAA